MRRTIPDSGVRFCWPALCSRMDSAAIVTPMPNSFNVLEITCCWFPTRQYPVQPFFIERFRQGFDAVGACWVNPALPESRFLWLGVLAAPLFYGVAVLRDFRRLLTGYRDLDLAMLQVPFALPLFPLFRLVDFAGMLRALVTR